MSKNFTLKELIASDVAEREGIDNTPSFEIVHHLEELCDNLLQPLRDAYGKPIFVTSGYRCKELNKKVGGVETSSHTIGYAADLQASDFDAFVAFVFVWLGGRSFDQCIIEQSKNEMWLHLGFKNSRGEQRCELKTIQK